MENQNGVKLWNRTPQKNDKNICFKYFWIDIKKNTKRTFGLLKYKNYSVIGEIICDTLTK